MHGQGQTRLQSSVEFLTTYSFVLIILAAAIFIVFAITATTRTNIKSQCVTFGSMDCNFVSYYSPRGASYSLLTFSMTNSQGGAINVTNVTASIGSLNYLGICSPSLVLPGQEATCIINVSGGGAANVAKSGFYAVNAKFCNLPVSVALSNCNQTASYTGSFYTYSVPFPTSIFSVIAAVGNSSVQLPAYTGSPQIPGGYAISNNGDWAGKENGTAIAYAFGTRGYGAGNYFGVGLTTFPSNLYYLGYNAVSCSPSYNTTFSLAYTAIYLNSPAAVTFNAYADNAIAAWYRPNGANTWNSVYGGVYWPVNSVSTPATSTVTLGRGLYSIAVGWANTCGPGLQAFEISGNGV